MAFLFVFFMKCLICLVEPCFYLLCTTFLRFSVVSLLHILYRGQHNTKSSLKIVEEVSVKCLCAGGDNLLCVSVCCQSVTSQVLLKRPKRWESLGLMLPNKLIICYSTMAERWWPTLTTVLIIRAVISISLDL